MPEAAEVTVVLSTYNRAPMLRDALKQFVVQTMPPAAWELLVVDNNSSDDTRGVVQRFLQDCPISARYLFEPRQGLSHARNTGIDAARAGIVAFTDDDVRVSPSWVSVIRDGFAKWPDVECLGGRTLPVWPFAPPRWLTRRHWIGPLALQDHGDTARVIDAARVCLAGANFAFRKRVFDKIGRFSADFPRAQDTELMLRMYRAGGRAMYVPDMLVHAPIDPERMTKAYHRRWHTNIGLYNARMQFEELADPVLGLRPHVPHFRRLWGIPVFAMRQFGGEIWGWLADTALGREADAFVHETRARSLVSYMKEARARATSSVHAAPIATPRSHP
jgi:glycosyltransferase involved in cell wall biosynthesis